MNRFVFKSLLFFFFAWKVYGLCNESFRKVTDNDDRLHIGNFVETHSFRTAVKRFQTDFLAVRRKRKRAVSASLWPANSVGMPHTTHVTSHRHFFSTSLSLAPPCCKTFVFSNQDHCYLCPPLLTWKILIAMLQDSNQVDSEMQITSKLKET